MPGWGGILIKLVDVEETIYKVVTLILGTWSDVLIPPVRHPSSSEVDAIISLCVKSLDNADQITRHAHAQTCSLLDTN